jgi:hypothetical protein|tara:strand:+ start:71 stop:643 length:573 start_codon:yes stop_codon:yes gene_type:complete
MVKRSFLVLGAESSCTRFITNCLIKIGCSGKTWNNDHEQEIDFKDPTEDLIVWRRSFPHKWDNPNNYPYIIKNTIGWPDTDAMYERLNKLGYEVIVVITMRDWYTTSMSGVNKGYRPHVNTLEKAYKNNKESYKRIFNFINKYNLDYTIINYEALVLNGKDYLNQILINIGLAPLKNINIKNGNIKYYER